MLQRFLRQQDPLHTIQSIAKSCTTCHCRCGKVLPQLHYVPRRGSAFDKAPVTRKKSRLKRSAPVTHAEWSQKRAAEEEIQRLEQSAKGHRRYEFHKALAGKKLLRDRGLNKDDVDSFLARFEEFGQLWPWYPSNVTRTRPSRGAQDRERAFRTIFKESGFDDEDITVIARALLLQSTEKHLRELGTALLFEASEAGNELATIRIMSSAYNQNVDGSALLQAPRVMQARQRLEHIGSVPAKVLHGRFANIEGNSALAAKLWTEAIEDSKRMAPQMSKDESRDALFDAMDPNTSSPWIDLAAYHMECENFVEAKWAIDIGCELDDPKSHYQAAWYYWSLSDPIPTSSKWLYHISKAAASGLPRAMHELGCWYAMCTWPYLTDEVPDSMRPSLFDSYPPEAGVEIEQTIESSVFATAAFPNSVDGRIRMAAHWLSIAVSLGYAPSCLSLARIYLNPTLNGNLAIPSTALNLSNNRYRYKNKAAYDSGNPDTSFPTYSPPPTAVQNPLYGRQQDGDLRAAQLIRDVFFADTASKVKADYHHQMREVTKKKRSQQAAAGARTQYPISVTRWLEHHISHSVFMKNGLLQDCSLVTNNSDKTDLLTQAKRICDEQNFEIYDDDGGLIYRPNLIKRRG